MLLENRFTSLAIMIGATVLVGVSSFMLTSDIPITIGIMIVVISGSLGLEVARRKMMDEKDYRENKCYKCKTQENTSVMKMNDGTRYNKCPNCPTHPHSGFEGYDPYSGSPISSHRS